MVVGAPIGVLAYSVFLAAPQVAPMAALSTIPLVVVVLVAVSTMRRASASIDRDGLNVGSGMYRLRVPFAQIYSARRVSGEQYDDVKPALRTNGMSLPGYHVGWYRLVTGRTALVYITDVKRVVHIVTVSGTDLLFSPADPEAFLAALAARTGNSRP